MSSFIDMFDFEVRQVKYIKSPNTLNLLTAQYKHKQRECQRDEIAIAFRNRYFFPPFFRFSPFSLQWFVSPHSLSISLSSLPLSLILHCFAGFQNLGFSSATFKFSKNKVFYFSNSYITSQFHSFLFHFAFFHSTHVFISQHNFTSLPLQYFREDALGKPGALISLQSLS